MLMYFIAVFFISDTMTSQGGAPYIVVPYLRLKLRVTYSTNTDDVSADVSQTCGEKFARTFLENLMNTEEIFWQR